MEPSNHLHPLEDGRVFVDYGPASMLITARSGGRNMPNLIEESFSVLERALAEIAAALPLLRRPNGETEEEAEGLAAVMLTAVRRTGEPTLTPMAAVAGTVADHIADWLFARGAEIAVVNNGGDIAIRLAAGESINLAVHRSGNASDVLRLRAEDGIGGVCTSGLGGRSLTRGIATSVSVFSDRAAIADAAATHIANCTFIDSPRVRSVRAGTIEPDSDIAELSVVTAVEALTHREVQQGLEQAQREAFFQLARGNLLYASTEIQGECLWTPEMPGTATTQGAPRREKGERK